MMEIIVVGAIVFVALAFVVRSLYHKTTGDSGCGCEGKLCSAKKKVHM